MELYKAFERTMEGAGYWSQSLSHAMRVLYKCRPQVKKKKFKIVVERIFKPLLKKSTIFALGI